MRRRDLVVLLLEGALLTLGPAACRRPTEADPLVDRHRDFIRILDSRRWLEPRLIGFDTWSPCPEPGAPPSGLRCGELLQPGSPEFGRLADLGRALDAAQPEKRPPRELHFQGVWNLVWAPGEAIRTALDESSWPAQGVVDDLGRRLGGQRKKMDRLREESGWKDWFGNTQNADRYRGLAKQMDQLAKTVGALTTGSDQQTEYAQARQQLRGWLPLLHALGEEESFSLRIPVECGIQYFKNEKTELEMTRRDRLEGDEAEETTETVATVTCPSHLAISTGLGVSGLEERDFGFVPSLSEPATGSVAAGAQDEGELIQRFGFENRSSDRINPMVLLNTRVKAWRSYGLHLSAGPVFDFDSQDSGISVGYVFGFSASARDNLFLTVGQQFARQASLAGGFEIGDPVPDGVTEPPLEKEWRNDWVVAVTYKIK